MRKYKRDGTPYPEGDVGLFQWCEDLENESYRVIKQEHLDNGYWVSTVWLGLNHQYGDGPPLIFETMVINPSGEWESFQRRYSTEADAIIGHLETVDEYSRKK